MSEQNKIDEIKEALAAATPGPWAWRGNTKIRSMFLAGDYGDTPFIMKFKRWGTQGAQPVFRGKNAMEKAETFVEYEVDYREDISGIKHPDAHLIAKAPEYITYLLAEIERKDEALKWYADVENRTYDDYCEDLGDRAREAL